MEKKKIYNICDTAHTVENSNLNEIIPNKNKKKRREKL